MVQLVKVLSVIPTFEGLYLVRKLSHLLPLSSESFNLTCLMKQQCPILIYKMTLNFSLIMSIHSILKVTVIQLGHSVIFQNFKVFRHDGMTEVI